MKISQTMVPLVGLMLVSACTASVTQEPVQAQVSGARAILGGGCFWCIEADFEKLAGVVQVVSGYTGGETASPTYEEVSRGRGGHIEVVEVTYDPARLTYDDILDYFWRHIDPTRDDGQFCDRGAQYRSAIFYTAEQKSAAERSLEKIKKSKPFAAPIKTVMRPVSVFTRAEEYHQDYYRKKPDHYGRYRTGCGRDARVRELWGASAAGKIH